MELENLTAISAYLTGFNLSNWKFPERYNFPACQNGVSVSNCVSSCLHSEADGDAAFINQANINTILFVIFVFNCSNLNNMTEYVQLLILSLSCKHASKYARRVSIVIQVLVDCINTQHSSTITISSRG